MQLAKVARPAVQAGACATANDKHHPRFAIRGAAPVILGELPTELVPHFFRSLAESLGAALHLTVKGENTHHMIEACFKGVGRALRQAFRIEGVELPSSKGML